MHIFDDEIPERFAELDIDYLHISGGNTFQMLDRIKKCGADRLILRYLQRGVSYIGGSAGAHIVTRNIEHLLPINGNPTGISDFQGLGVFEGILFCHFTQERRPLYEKAGFIWQGVSASTHGGVKWNDMLLRFRKGE